MSWDRSRRRSFLWRHVELPSSLRSRHIDVAWFPFHIVPIWINSRAVITVHDLSFVALPNLFDRKTRAYLGLLLARALAQATHLVAISQFTADELMRRRLIPASKISVIHHGRSEELRPLTNVLAESLMRRIGLQEPFYLFLDGANKRKNLALLLRALQRHRSRGFLGASIVVTGDRAEISRLVRAHGLETLVGTQLLLPGFVEIDELDVLYRNANALLYLSQYEGFGLPILEAFQRNCPVVALNASSLPEVAGDAAIYVDNGHTDQLMEAIELTMSPNVRAELATLGQNELRRFSWQRAADQYCATFLRTCDAET